MMEKLSGLHLGALKVARWGGRIALAVATLITAVGAATAAQVGTDQPASVLVFPKVIADGTYDTVIQITNVSSFAVPAICFYVDASNGGYCSNAPVSCLADSDCAPGGWCPSQCSETNFQIFLTGQQPTHWVVSSGRGLGSDPSCSPTNADCNGAGYSPGLVPPRTPGFRGELVCVEIDPSGLPLPGNSLIGEATLKDLTTGDVAKYNATGFVGASNNDGNGTLCLGGGVTPDCPNGAEYAACPQSWILNHLSEGAEDGLVGTGSALRTNLTIVPCSQNFEAQSSQPVHVLFRVTTEFEQAFSSSITTGCWRDVPLSSLFVFNFAVTGSTYLQTSVRAWAGSSGIIVMAQESRDSGGPQPATTSAMVMPYAEGTRSAPDLMVFPPFQ